MLKKTNRYFPLADGFSILQTLAGMKTLMSKYIYNIYWFLNFRISVDLTVPTWHSLPVQMNPSPPQQLPLVHFRPLKRRASLSGRSSSWCVPVHSDKKCTGTVIQIENSGKIREARFHRHKHTWRDSTHGTISFNLFITFSVCVLKRAVITTL